MIGGADLVESLRKLLGADADIRVFSEAEPIKALQAILELQPDLIALASSFATSSRGIALLNRIQSDPALASSEVRVVTPGEGLQEPVRRGSGGTAAATLDDPAAAAVAAPAADPSRPLDWRGTRRILRTRVRSGVEIQLDGKPCAVVDLSPLGVQVVSTTILKPNQRVRVVIPVRDTSMRFGGTVIWARFELPVPTAPPVYRSGVEFIDADQTALAEFCSRNRQ